MLFCSFASQAAAQGAFSLHGQLSSDWIYHGRSDVQDEPTVGVNFEYLSSAGVFVGAERHWTEVGSASRDQRSSTYYAGYHLPLRADWYLTAALKKRTSKGSISRWNYEELYLQVTLPNGLSARVDYADDYYSRDLQALSTEVHYRQNFNDQWFWQANLGYQVLEQRQDNAYGMLAAGIALKNTRVRLAVHWTRDDDLQFPSAEGDGHWVLSISHVFL